MLWLAKDENKASKDYDAVARECPEGKLPPGTYMVYDYIRAEAE